jgi:Zn-finger nucleic acid-binding protein
MDRTDPDGRETHPVMPFQRQVRVLNACPKCDRQYDVSHLDVGRRVRCECGERFEVRIEKPRDPRVLKCAHCGGLLVDGASTCAYCSAQITVEERRLSAVCPRCFARTAADARYCMECGIRIDPQAIHALTDETACPRCRTELRSRSIASIPVAECSGCGGMWLSIAVFVRACEQAEAERTAPGESPSSNAPRAVPPDEPVHYLPCPVCGSLMGRKNYATSSGVIIDVCATHGVWLDAQELHAILAFIRGGGLERSRRRELERLREEERHASVERAVREVRWAQHLPSSRRGVLSGDPNVWLLRILDLL